MWRVVALLVLAGGAGWGAEPMDGAVALAFERAESGLSHFVVMARAAVTAELDLAVALGSLRAIAEGERFHWGEEDVVGLYLQERSRPGMVYALGRLRGFPDCFARVERVTATDTVISCRGEKAMIYPHQKWVYDVRAKGLVGQFSYDPVPLLRAGVTGETVVLDGAGRGMEYRNGAFRVVNGRGVPSEAKPAVTVRDGTRTWSAKSFYAGEGHSGVGGFGFHDAATGERKLFSPPEIVDWSVSAMAVETPAVWLALVHNGEWGGGSGGLLRFDRETGTVRRFALPDIGRGIALVSGRVFVATEFGAAVVEGDRVRRYFLDRTLDGRWRVVEVVR